MTASQPPSHRRRAIVVLGMHRSGTSALTGLCRTLGATVGPAKKLIEPSRFNERGFFEVWDFVRLHNRLLREFGLHWSDPAPLPDFWESDLRIAAFREELASMVERYLADAPLWVVKDPRLCRLLPLWWPVFEAFDCDPVFTLVLRNPLESALSLEAFQHIGRDRALALWLRHVLEAERHTRGHPRLLVRYEDVLADSVGVAHRLSSRLGVDWPVDVKTAKPELERLLDPSLRHACIPPAHLLDAADVHPWVRRAFAALCDAAQADDLDGVRETFDAISGDLAAADGWYGPIVREQLGQLFAAEAGDAAEDRGTRKCRSLASRLIRIVRRAASRGRPPT